MNHFSFRSSQGQSIALVLFLLGAWWLFAGELSSYDHAEKLQRGVAQDSGMIHLEQAKHR